MALKNDWKTGEQYTADDQNDVADAVNGRKPGVPYKVPFPATFPRILAAKENTPKCRI